MPESWANSKKLTDLVCPGLSETLARPPRVRELMRDDLPTLDLPTKATSRPRRAGNDSLAVAAATKENLDTNF